jgi:hypothetical protein
VLRPSRQSPPVKAILKKVGDGELFDAAYAG